jgi:hypothetical protein
MASKYWPACIQKLLLSFFLASASADLGSEAFKTCIACRGKSKSKQEALEELHPNVPPKRRSTVCTHPKPLIPPPALLESCSETPVPPPNPPKSRSEHPILLYNPPLPRPEPSLLYVPTSPPPPAPGFLPDDQWQWIQIFHKAIAAVDMETCSHCREHWFSMDLKDAVCHSCYLRDKGSQTPFLMSADNEMDTEDVPAYLPVLTQIKEMIIARSHVQMLVYRYRRHQYHYSGHCVSFIQNTVKTVSVVPNLPSELDIVLLRPSNQVIESDSRYQQQFRADFRVRRSHVLAWLRYLKANHPDYRYITILLDRVNTLPIDISSSIVSLIDDGSIEEPGA